MPIMQDDRSIGSGRNAFQPWWLSFMALTASLIIGQIGCATSHRETSHSTEVPESWRTNFFLFAKAARDVASQGRVPSLHDLEKRAEAAPGSVYAMTDGAGGLVELPPRPGTAGYLANRFFEGQDVKWIITLFSDTDTRPIFGSVSFSPMQYPPGSSAEQRQPVIVVPWIEADEALFPERQVYRAGETLVIEGRIGSATNSTRRRLQGVNAAYHLRPGYGAAPRTVFIVGLSEIRVSKAEDEDARANLGALMRIPVTPLPFRDPEQEEAIRELERRIGGVTWEKGSAVNIFWKNREITDGDITLLTALPNLRSLTLSGTQITDSAFRHIAELRNLQHLQASHTAVTDAGISNLARLSKLENLWLAGTSVTDEGVAHLSGLVRLGYLELGGTAVTDDCLEHLTKMKRLYYLGVADTKVTEQGLRALATKLPRLTAWNGEVRVEGEVRRRSNK